LVVLRGSCLGQQYPLDRHELLIGRIGGADVRLSEDTVSRRHARVCRQAHRFVVEDIGSTNGTFVNEQRVKLHELRHGDLLQVGDTVLKFLSGDSVETRYHDEIYRLSTFDCLTETYNRAYFERCLNREINRCIRHRHPLSVAILDVDLFKSINDTFGHLAGDAILRELAGLLKRAVRTEDILSRYGGEEFAFIFPEAGPSVAHEVCERLRRTIQDHPFVWEGHILRITVSLGCFSIARGQADTSVEQVLKAADTRLYAAKSAGRNCVR
jgi:diguanylate cyclase (GGDEF)-like protein